ncbi:uncharacterized protein [Spinacia oleracea]|uniref:Uncharacterized protein n=1 Tax=Spinacia oleracea TaxID=3562 RepID=A0A9R0K7T4_SPIOL|nr:uncharacterized protein LOC110800685 [Spinacia oleracea]
MIMVRIFIFRRSSNPNFISQFRVPSSYMSADQTAISSRPGGGGSNRGPRFLGPRFDSSSSSTYAAAASDNLRPHGAASVKVYEYITYDNERHIALASLPGMQERTIITSSLSKTYYVTGHKRVVTLREVVECPCMHCWCYKKYPRKAYYKSLREDYELRRDFITEMLSGIGFQVEFKPQGSFFIFAELLDCCEQICICIFSLILPSSVFFKVPKRRFYGRHTWTN